MTVELRTIEVMEPKTQRVEHWTCDGCKVTTLDVVVNDPHIYQTLGPRQWFTVGYQSYLLSFCSADCVSNWLHSDKNSGPVAAMGVGNG